MKITIPSRDFAEATAFVARMTPKRPTAIILTGVMLRAEGDRLHLSVYDHEQAAATALAADVADEGVALVNATMLAQVSAKLPRADVVLEVAETSLKLRCGSVRASLPLMPAEEYPAPDFESEMLAVFPGAVFEDAIGRVALAASSDDATPILFGVHTTVGDGQVTFAATDRYRIAHMPVACETGAEATVTIPATVLRETAKSLSASEQIVMGITGNGMVTFRGDRGTILTRTLTGNFPPVERLFPTDPKATAIVDREAATEATLRGALAIEVLGAVKFTFADGECRMEGASEGKGVTEEFDAEFDASELTVALRPQFMVDGLTACRSAKVTLDFTHAPGDKKPGAVMFSGGDGYRYLLQPNLLLR